MYKKAKHFQLVCTVLQVRWEKSALKGYIYEIVTKIDTIDSLGFTGLPNPESVHPPRREFYEVTSPTMLSVRWPVRSLNHFA